MLWLQKFLLPAFTAIVIGSGYAFAQVRAPSGGGRGAAHDPSESIIHHIPGFGGGSEFNPIVFFVVFLLIAGTVALLLRTPIGALIFGVIAVIFVGGIVWKFLNTDFGFELLQYILWYAILALTGVAISLIYDFIKRRRSKAAPK